jgi:hypothetical protein
MWAVNNNTPFAAERSWVRDKDGAEVWVVAVKGTFRIDDNGAARLAEQQSQVCIAPEFRGKPGQSSLLRDSDLHCKKSSTDVVIHGHAYAPRGRAAARVDVSLKVRGVDKTLRVTGDRTWRKSGNGIAMTPPEPFIRMPLTYERAFGGIDQASINQQYHGWLPCNPVGVGFSTRKEDLIDKPAPNIEDPAKPIMDWHSRPTPVGFGPIAAHWSPRVELAGTYDEKWARERQPLWPDDFDERFFHCAPHDQQVPGFLRGGEEVELRNLTPSGLLRFRLPVVNLRFTTCFLGHPKQVQTPLLHSVILEPDVPQFSMVWHTHLPCHDKVLKLMTTYVSILRPDDISDHRQRVGHLV